MSDIELKPLEYMRAYADLLDRAHTAEARVAVLEVELRDAAAETARLTAALAECQERALRTMQAQQDEIERLRAAALDKAQEAGQ